MGAVAEAGPGVTGTFLTVKDRHDKESNFWIVTLTTNSCKATNPGPHSLNEEDPNSTKHRPSRSAMNQTTQNQQTYQQMYPKGSKPTALPPGKDAPDFSLRSTPDQFVTLSDFRGRPVILAFYPADWSPVCGDQMGLYNEILSEFQNFGADLLGISVDGAWCHAAFCKDRKLHFPLLADFEPKGAVAQTYGVYRKTDGVSERALFVIDPEGKIHWSYVSPLGVNPGAAGILSALESLQPKEVTK